MKDCKTIHPLLSAYLDKALSSGEKSRVEAHLKACADARKELDQIKSLREVMIAIPEPQIPHGLHEKIMAKVQGRPVPKIPHRPFWTVPTGLLAVAAMVTLYLTVLNPNLVNLGSIHQPQKAETPAPGAGTTFAEIEKKVTSPPSQKQSDISTLSNQTSGYEGGKDTNGIVSEKELQPSASKPMAKMEKKSVKMEETMDENKSGSTGAMGPSANVLAVQTPPEMTFEGASTVTQPATAENAPVPNALSSTPLVSAGANLPPAPTPTALSSWSGSYNPSSSEFQEVVTDAATFQKYWQTFQPDKPTPTVDFTTQAVVVLMDQERLYQRAGPHAPLGHGHHRKTCQAGGFPKGLNKVPLKT
jgi:hypothetical protein